MIISKISKNNWFIIFLWILIIACSSENSSKEDPNDSDIVFEEGEEINTFWITNPTTNARLYVKLFYPSSWDQQATLPTLIMIPGGNSDSTLFTSITSTQPAQDLAEEGFLILVFDPDGRGQSEGTENYGGFDHQDGLATIVRFALTRSEVNQIGFFSNSYGVTMASGVLSRYSDLEVQFLIDFEGPADRNDTGGCDGDGGGHLSTVASCDDEAFWSEREAVTFISQIQVSYQRIQTVDDHVKEVGDYQHAIALNNAAINGGVDWVRINNLTANQIYSEETLTEEMLIPEPEELNIMEIVASYAQELLE